MDVRDYSEKEALPQLFTQSGVFTAVGKFQTLSPRQNDFADADILGCNFKHFVVVEELDCFFKAELARSVEAECFVGTCGAHVGDVFTLADVDADVLVLG